MRTDTPTGSSATSRPSVRLALIARLAVETGTLLDVSEKAVDAINRQSWTTDPDKLRKLQDHLSELRERSQNAEHILRDWRRQN